MTVLLLLAAANPARIAHLSATVPEANMRRRTLALGGSIAVILLLAGCSQPIIDSLDITAPSMDIAAGAAVAASALGLLIHLPRPWDQPVGRLPSWIAPLSVPILVTPDVAAAAISRGVAHGAIPTAAAIAVAWIVGDIAAQHIRPHRLMRWAARAIAVVAVIAAIGLIVDGIRSV